MFCDVCVFFFFFLIVFLNSASQSSYGFFAASAMFTQFWAVPSCLQEAWSQQKEEGKLAASNQKKEATLSFFPPLKGEFTTYKYFLMLHLHAHLHAHHSHCLTLDMKRGRCHSCKQDKLAPLRYSLQHYCSSGELHCTRTLLGPLQKAQFQHELCQTHDNLAGLTVR